MNFQEDPKTKPHYGASLIDYSPSRTATPPYPSERITSPDVVAQESESALPPPPPPMTTEVNQNHEVRTPPPPSKKQKVKVKTIVHNGDGCDAIEDDWKKEVNDFPCLHL